jgi:hypothetical protein
VSTTKFTGKAAVFQVAGTAIGFTKIGVKTDRKLADSTDSANYDSGSDLIWPEQLPIQSPITFTVELRYNLTTTPANVINTLYTGSAAVAVVVKLNATTTYGHGNFDIESFDANVPYDDVVTGTAQFKSNGLFTFGS